MRTLFAAVLAVASLAGCSSTAPSGNQPQVSFTMNVTVPAGKELFECQFVKMPASAADQFVVAAEHTYTPGSHHLLLFRTDVTTLAPGMDQLQDCYEGGGGTVMSHVRGVLYGSQIPKGSETLPSGIGFKMASEEVLLLQVHYLNATTSDVNASVDVGLFTTTDATKIQTLAGVLFYYDPFIDVPPSVSNAKAGARCTLPQDINLFTVFPHYHSRGVGYQAYLDAPGAAPSATPFYTSTDWEHPAPFNGGPMTVAKGTQIRWYCDYDNSDPTKEYFQGPSAADNEMCMFTGVYWPAMDQASEFCLSTMDNFGTGSATCAQTSTCIEGCPAGSAPMNLGSGTTDGTADVSPCWQKCIVDSCAAASGPLFAQMKCIGDNCATQCAAGGGDCLTCAAQMCANEINTCNTAACN